MQKIPPLYRILRVLSGIDAARFPLERKLRFFQLRYHFSVRHKVPFSASQSAALFGVFAIPPLVENQAGKTAAGRMNKFLSNKGNATFYRLCFPKNRLMNGVFSVLSNREENDIQKRCTAIRNSNILFDTKFALATHDYGFGYNTFQKLEKKIRVGITSDGFKDLFPYHKYYMPLIYSFTRNNIDTCITHLDRKTFYEQFVQADIVEPRTFEKVFREWIYIKGQIKDPKKFPARKHLDINALEISPELKLDPGEPKSLGFQRHKKRKWLDR